MLVAGCGTSQAARHALRRPSAHVIGIDISETSIRHTLELKQKYNLSNLDVHQLPIEQVEELGEVFDPIVCTGVLHHLSDPQSGLRALRDGFGRQRRPGSDGVCPLRPGGGVHAAGILPPAGDRAATGDPRPGTYPDSPAAQPPLGAPFGGFPDFQSKDGWQMRCSIRRTGLTPYRSCLNSSNRSAEFWTLGAPGAVSAAVRQPGYHAPCLPPGDAPPERAVRRPGVVSRDHAAPQSHRLPG